MAAKKTNAMSAKGTQKANESNITRKSATKGVIKNAQMTVEDVVASVRLNTKGKLKDLEMRKGILYRGGEQMLEFTEKGLGKQATHPWEIRQKLAEEKPYARISANSNGGFLGIYVPRENFKTNREFLETLLDMTELLVEKMDGVDTIGAIDNQRELKRKILETA